MTVSIVSLQAGHLYVFNREISMQILTHFKIQLLDFFCCWVTFILYIFARLIPYCIKWLANIFSCYLSYHSVDCFLCCVKGFFFKKKIYLFERKRMHMHAQAGGWQREKNLKYKQGDMQRQRISSRPPSPPRAQSPKLAQKKMWRFNTWQNLKPFHKIQLSFHEKILSHYIRYVSHGIRYRGDEWYLQRAKMLFTASFIIATIWYPS